MSTKPVTISNFDGTATVAAFPFPCVCPPGTLVRLSHEYRAEDETLNRFRVHKVEMDRMGNVRYFLAGRWVPSSWVEPIEGQPTAALVVTEKR